MVDQAHGLRVLANEQTPDVERVAMRARSSMRNTVVLAEKAWWNDSATESWLKSWLQSYAKSQSEPCNFHFVEFGENIGCFAKNQTFEVLVVCGSDAIQITNAYAEIKSIVKCHPVVALKLVMVRGRNVKQAEGAAKRLCLVCKQFLGVQVEWIGTVGSSSLASSEPMKNGRVI